MENVQKVDHYEAVLADLRARRQKIDNTIAMLEQIRAGGLPGLSDTPKGERDTPAAEAASATPLTGPGAFFGMTIHDATMKLLRAQRREMRTTAIVPELERGGIRLTGDKPNTVGSLLLRRFYTVGDIVRVSRGTWGLQEWYPGRKFPKGKGSENDKGNEHEENAVGNEQGTRAFGPPSRYLDLGPPNIGPDVESDTDTDPENLIG
jgi:hypothetical protein